MQYNVASLQWHVGFSAVACWVFCNGVLGFGNIYLEETKEPTLTDAVGGGAF